MSAALETAKGQHPRQDEIMSLLSNSPLPWTHEMIVAWFGRNHATYLNHALAKRRVWRIERGIYTCKERYVPARKRPAKFGPKIILSDEMIQRYTGLSF